MKKSTSLALAIILFAGCGTPTEEELKEGKNKINESYTPSANNQQSASNKDINSNSSGGTSLGYIGADVKLGENKVVDNYWSLYIATDTMDSYNTYIYGYKFFQNGSLTKRDASIEYKTYLKSWGVDAKGSVITISPDEKYIITSRFTTDKNCYLVSTTLISSAKLCNEAAINASYPKNSVGHYGNGVKLGNYGYGNIEAVGKWEFSTVTNGIVDAVSKNYTLGSEGKILSSDTNPPALPSQDVQSVLEWGVSDDGKVLGIGSSKYLIYKYYSQNCLLLSQIDGSTLLGQYQVCKK